MKTLIIVGLTFCSMISAHAQDFESKSGIETATYLAQVKIKDGTFELHVYLAKKEGAKDALQVILRDSFGTSLWLTRIDKRQKQASIFLDLSNLPDDTYTLEISDRASTKTKKFYKESEAILIKAPGQLVAIN